MIRILAYVRKNIKAPKGKPASTEKGKPASTEKGKPASADEGKHASADEGKHASADEGKPTSADKGTDEGKPASIDEGKPASADEGKHASADEGKPASADESKPASADESKPESIDKGKPASADEGKHASADEGKPASADESKPASADESKPNSVDKGKLASTDEGKPASADEGKPVQDAAPATVVFVESRVRKVILEPGDIVLKTGSEIHQSEVEALKVVAGAGIPAPVLLGVSNSGKWLEIRMSLVPGETLEKLWPDMSTEQKTSVAMELCHILKQMRKVPPPPNYIGHCDGSGIRESRPYFTYYGETPCTTEAQFNDYLNSSLFRQAPSLLRAAFSSQLKTNHRIVLSHNDLAPRNIMIHNGKISGILDWEECGWYPEYWEFVKFFEQHSEWDWKAYAHIILPEQYLAELVTYTAMSKWRAN